MSLKSSHLGESFTEQIIGKANRESMSSADLSYMQIFTNLASCTFQTVLGYICLDLMLAISLHYIQVHNGPIADAGVGLAYTILNAVLIPMGLGNDSSSFIL